MTTPRVAVFCVWTYLWFPFTVLFADNVDNRLPRMSVKFVFPLTQVRDVNFFYKGELLDEPCMYTPLEDSKLLITMNEDVTYKLDEMVVLLSSNSDMSDGSRLDISLYTEHLHSHQENFIQTISIVNKTEVILAFNFNEKNGIPWLTAQDDLSLSETSQLEVRDGGGGGSLTRQQQQQHRKQQIPRIVYQAWITDIGMPVRMKEIFDQWRTMNPEYTFVFFDYAQQAAWMKQNCQIDDRDYYPAWADMLMPTARADLFRYCLMYIQGGLWVDMDVVPLVPLRDFMQNSNEELILTHDGGMPEINPGYAIAFLASIPRHPIMEASLDYIYNHHEQRVRLAVGACTGPIVLWSAAKHVLGYTQPMTFYGIRDNIRYFYFDTVVITTGPPVTGRGKEAAEAADVARTVMIGKYEGYSEEAVAHGGELHYGRWVEWAT